MKIAACLSVLTLFSLFIYSCNTKPTETAALETKISGRILDKANNTAIAGALVTTNPTTSAVTTDGSGSYTIENLKPGQYVVSVSKSGYQANSINVLVAEGKTNSADIQMEMLKPELTLSTQTLDFGITHSSVSLIISNGSGGNSIDWTAATNAAWLSLSQTSGTVSTASEIITLSVNRNNLSFGNYSATVTISSSGGRKEVSVTMTIANPNAPQLTVNPVVLDMGSLLTQATINISNSGTGKFGWTASSTAGWISLSPASDSTNTEVDVLKVTINRSGLTPGSYNGDIAVISNAGSQNVNVKMTVPTIPTLSVSTNNLDFDSTTAQLSFNILNTGTGTLTWTATGSPSWLSVQPQSGTDGGLITVTVSRTGLTPGIYNGAVTLSSNGGGGSVGIAMRVPYPAAPSPVNATAGAVTTTSVQLNWSQSVNTDFAAYKIYYSTSPDVDESSTLGATISSSSTTNYTVVGLSNNTTYYFRVFVVSRNQMSSGSNTVTGKTERVPATWQQIALPANFQVQSTHYISESNIWVAGYTTIGNYNFPRIFQYNGSKWTQSNVQSQDSVGVFKGIAFRNNTEGFASTAAGRIYQYNGSSWNIINYTDYDITEAIGTTTDVWFYGRNVPYSVYNKPLFYRWSGSDFTENILNSFGSLVRDAHFHTSNIGFSIDASGDVYHFNGSGWMSLGKVAGGKTVSGVSQNDVWVSTGDYLYHFDGTTWNRQNDIGGNAIRYQFLQIRMISATEGWGMAGGNGAYYFNGTSWSKVATVSGAITAMKNFGNGDLCGIILGSPNILMRLH